MKKENVLTSMASAAVVYPALRKEAQEIAASIPQFPSGHVPAFCATQSPHKTQQEPYSRFPSGHVPAFCATAPLARCWAYWSYNTVFRNLADLRPLFAPPGRPSRPLGAGNPLCFECVAGDP
jgi:hypothetical protein